MTDDVIIPGYRWFNEDLKKQIQFMETSEGSAQGNIHQFF